MPTPTLRISVGSALVALAVLASTVDLPRLASAQTNAGSQLPSYATGEEFIRGRIVSFDGKYRLAVHDDRGFIDNVTLHNGTVINPTGLRLATGETVKISGRTDGSTFRANEIDTPYQNYGSVPYSYGYPAYGYGGFGFAPYGYRYRPFDSQLRFGVRGYL